MATNITVNNFAPELLKRSISLKSMDFSLGFEINSLGNRNKNMAGL